jgi:hypothetical protein
MTKSGTAGCGGLSLTNTGYLHRLRDRKELHEVKRGVLFGLIVGWFMTLVGAFHYFFQLDGKAWLYGCCAGAALLTMTVIFPQIVCLLQEAVQVVGGFVASQILKLVLTIIYFTVVLPIGLISQRTNGSRPFYSWSDAAPENGEGWVDKKVTADVHWRRNVGFASAITQPVYLLQYFLANAQSILLPCLIICLVIGLLAIFAESSVMAPLIYTLF